MAQPKETSFTAWEFSVAEEKAACIFNDLNIKRLQNLQAEAAEQLVGLLVDPLNISEFIQRQAYLSSQVALLKYLLDAHNTASIVIFDSLG